VALHRAGSAARVCAREQCVPRSATLAMPTAFVQAADGAIGATTDAAIFAHLVQEQQAGLASRPDWQAASPVTDYASDATVLSGARAHGERSGAYGMAATHVAFAYGVRTGERGLAGTRTSSASPCGMVSRSDVVRAAGCGRGRMCDLQGGVPAAAAAEAPLPLLRHDRMRYMLSDTHAYPVVRSEGRSPIVATEHRTQHMQLRSPLPHLPRLPRHPTPFPADVPCGWH
jgi:hypothetical protein